MLPIKKLRTTRSRTSLSLIQSVLNSLQNCRCSSIFTVLLVQYSYPYKLHQTFSSANFQRPILLLIVHKITLTIPTNTFFFYTSALFHLPIFAYSDPYNLRQNYFPYLSHLANSGCVQGINDKKVL